MNLPSAQRHALVKCRMFLVSAFLIWAITSQADSQSRSAEPGMQAAAKHVTQVIAHRGASVERPECTLAAIRRAIEVGATAVEVDVRTSSDGGTWIQKVTMLDAKR